MKLLFIGECRSLTAKRKNWTWKDGRLAAKPLFEALRAMGVDPAAHEYMNLWTDDPKPKIRPGLKLLMHWSNRDVTIIALGAKVSRELARRGVVHVALVHPAARGKIRKRATYHAHVADKLGAIVNPQPKSNRKGTAP